MCFICTVCINEIGQRASMLVLTCSILFGTQQCTYHIMTYHIKLLNFIIIINSYVICNLANFHRLIKIDLRYRYHMIFVNILKIS